MLRLRQGGKGGGRPWARRFIVIGKRFNVHQFHHTKLSLAKTSV
jgi:hypothetical protein